MSTVDKTDVDTGDNLLSQLNSTLYKINFTFTQVHSVNTQCPLTCISNIIRSIVCKITSFVLIILHLTEI